jgi:Fis family transcriptional regulator
MTQRAIDDCLRSCVEQYLQELNGAAPAAMHELFMGAAERPLLEVVLRHAEGNQSKAAQWLGINRNTLRRKLLDHRLL